MEQFALATLIGVCVMIAYLLGVRSSRLQARSIGPGQAAVEAERYMMHDLQYQEEVVRLKDDNALLRVTKTAIESELAEAKKRADDTTAEREMRMAVLRGELEQMRREREHLKSEQARVELENQHQSQRITELARDFTDTQAELIRLRISLGEAEAKLEEGRRLFRDDIQELFRQIAPPVIAPNADLRMEYDLAREEVSRLRTLLAESDIERERLAAETHKLAEERDAARGETHQLRKALAEAESSRSGEADLAGLLESERLETARLRSLVEEAAEAERQAETLQVEVEKARVERDSYRQEASRLRALLAIANAGQNRQNAATADVERLKAELSAAQLRAEEAAQDRKRLAEAKLELSKLRDEVEMLESQNSQLHASMAEAASRVAEARRAANARMTDIAALQHQIDELRLQSTPGVAAAAAA